MLNDLLRQLGFSDKESLVYSTVLESGRLSYTDLAHKTSLNRTTTYSAARALIDRGLLQEDFSTPVKALVAAPPEALAELTIREEKALNERKALVEKTIATIRALPTTAGYVAPTITFIPQERIARHLRERSETWNCSMLLSDQTWWGFTDAGFVANYGEAWLSWYLKEKPKDIKARLFSNESEVGRAIMSYSPPERQIRPWTGDHIFTGSFWIAGEYVVTVNVSQSPHYLIEMRDKTLAQNLRTVFATLWQTTNPATTDIADAIK